MRLMLHKEAIIRRKEAVNPQGDLPKQLQRGK